MCFLLVLSLYRFDMDKIISKFQTSISWWKERWRSYICIPSGAHTHMMTHTKREPHGRLRDPFLCRKTILETIKSVSISDYYNFVFLHLPLFNRCLVITVVFSYKFLITDFATSFKVNIQFDHFRSQNNSEKLSLK